MGQPSPSRASPPPKSCCRARTVATTASLHCHHRRGTGSTLPSSEKTQIRSSRCAFTSPRKPSRLHHAVSTSAPPPHRAGRCASTTVTLPRMKAPRHHCHAWRAITVTCGEKPPLHFKKADAPRALLRRISYDERLLGRDGLFGPSPFLEAALIKVRLPKSIYRYAQLKTTASKNRRFSEAGVVTPRPPRPHRPALPRGEHAYT